MSLKSKKGNIAFESILILVILGGMAIIAPIAYLVFTDLNTDIQADLDLSNETKSMSSDMQTRFPSLLDGLFIFALVLLWIFAIVSAFLIDTHPIFFVVAIILLVFIIIIGGAVNNLFNDMAGDADFSTSFNAFPLTTWVMNNLVVVIVFLVVSMILALYGKNKFMGGGI